MMLGNALVSALLATLLVVLAIGLVLLMNPIAAIEIAFVVYMIVRLRRDKIRRGR